MTIELIISLLIGYLVGSIPSAYLILKFFKDKDIRKLGSGNVGTLNSYEVTNSKLIGISVLISDSFKGILSVLIVKYGIGNEFIYLAASLNAAVLGHCYSIWLKFKGGRGLATAAGGSLVFSPAILISWLFSWYLVHKFKKDIHIANVAATAFVIILVSVFSSFLNSFTFPSAESNFIFAFSISLLMVIILSKHIEPMKEFMRNKKLEDS
jgi:glycerol-3-phosphate acyltransferase PlsY